MSKRKALLTVVALVLVCVFSITGTIAFLHKEANGDAGITNTFVSGDDILNDPDDPDEPGEFIIEEPKITTDENGNVIVDSSASAVTGGQEYPLLPGIELPKDAKIKINGKTTVPAYLYVEVIDNLTDGVYEWGIEDCWEALTDGTGKSVIGPKNGKVYVYTEGGKAKAFTENTPAGGIGIIEGGKLTVKDVSVEDITSDSLSFYAYLVQSASFDSAYEAYSSTYATSTLTSSSR